jgi:hypothetical protein
MSHSLPDAESVTRAFGLLQHGGEHLSPADRGGLMLSLSETADAVFKSEHPTLTKIDAALRLLERAKQKHLSGEIDRLVTSLIEAIRRGEVRDNLALEMRLREIKSQLTKESEDGNKN